MAKGSSVTAGQAPPPSIQAGTVMPGEVAGFPGGSITPTQQMLMSVAPSLSKVTASLVSPMIHAPQLPPWSGGQMPSIDPQRFAVKKPSVTFNPNIDALRKLGSLY